MKHLCLVGMQRGEMDIGEMRGENQAGKSLLLFLQKHYPLHHFSSFEKYLLGESRGASIGYVAFQT